MLNGDVLIGITERNCKLALSYGEWWTMHSPIYYKMRFIMNDKLILIKEYKLFINRYEFIVINVDNRYKDLKTRIINGS